MTETDREALVSALNRLTTTKDRGALAALRSGLGKPPGTVARMFPIVTPYLSSDGDLEVKTAFLTASLFGKHPIHDAKGGSLGASLRKAIENGKHGKEGVEERLAAALDADPEDLQRHLEGLVGLCENAGVGINYYQLCRDLPRLLGNYEESRDRVRLRWAREFWRGPRQEENTQTKEEQA